MNTEGKIMYCSYEKYEETSNNYDTLRKPVAVELIKKHINIVTNNMNKLPKDLVLLDAGCGTGNYIVEFNEIVGRIIGIEFNDGMLKKAEDKLKSVPNVELIKASLFNIPLNDESVDVILINQVIHHLEDSSKFGQKIEGKLEFPNVERVLHECYRVLRKGGVLLINLSLPIQMKGHWFVNHLYPHIIQKYRPIMPDLNYMKDMLQRKFSSFESRIVYEPLIRDEGYFSPESAFSKSFRDCNSSWSLLSQEELNNAMDILKELITSFGSDNLKELFKKELETFGQSTETICYK